MSVERRLMDEVDRLRGDVVEYTRGMVRIPSENPPGDESEIGDNVSGLLASIGFDVERGLLAIDETEFSYPRHAILPDSYSAGDYHQRRHQGQRHT